MTTTEVRAKYHERKGQQEQISIQLEDKKIQLTEENFRGKRLEKAQVILQIVAKETQQALEYRISELVTLALEAVFPDPYKLKLRFTIRRGRTEADLLFEDATGNEIDPMRACGGGVVDVAAFGLRCAVWSLQQPRSRNTIIMDEPFRFVSTDLQPLAGEMLKEVSKQLKLQFILVTHEEELLATADKVVKVKQARGVSQGSAESSGHERAGAVPEGERSAC